VAHISEDELALFAFSANAVSPERREVIEQHTAACASCRATRDFFAVAEEDLSDVDMWEHIAGSATLEALSAYAERIAEEDAEAEEILAPLFAAPAKAAWKNLLAEQRFRTGGVARRLSTHAHEVCENEPLAALTFADHAITIAETLADDLYPAKAVYELRGKAWEERANAQRVLGDCAAAYEALDHAERAYNHLASPSLGLARVAYIRASALYQQEHLEEAAAVAERAEHAFAHLGDDDRRMKALFLRASIMVEARNLNDAAALFRRFIDYGETLKNARWIASGSNALGHCEIYRGNFAEASLLFHHAIVFFREHGPANERLGTEWGIAEVLLHGGKRHEAVRRLRDVSAEFERRGQVTEAALVGLDIADALLTMGHASQIVDLAGRLFRVFTEAGMLKGALTAMAYLKEAAASGTLTSEDVRAVRGFLKRAARQPNLLFLPPPGNR
jgi:tetratricopeptide (TPR) repeat protein